VNATAPDRRPREGPPVGRGVTDLVCQLGTQHNELAILPGTDHGEHLFGGITARAADVALEKLIETASSASS
jgi:hypothetical protein